MLFLLGALFTLPLILLISRKVKGKRSSPEATLIIDRLGIHREGRLEQYTLIPWENLLSFEIDETEEKKKITFHTDGLPQRSSLIRSYYYIEGDLSTAVSAIEEWRSYTDKFPHRPTKEVTPCKVCGKGVSVNAQVCPSCGEFAPGLYIKCPMCNSMSFRVTEKGFQMSQAAAGAILLGPVGLIAGMSGHKDIQFTCLKCNHKWRPSPESLLGVK